MIIVFLGRNTEGILADAQREFGDEPVLVITRDGDQLQPPAGVESVAVSQFIPVVGQRYTLVANGGTTTQLLPVLKRLVETGAEFTAYDLQRDGRVEVWSQKATGLYRIETYVWDGPAEMREFSASSDAEALKIFNIDKGTARLSRVVTKEVTHLITSRE